MNTRKGHMRTVSFSRIFRVQWLLEERGIKGKGGEKEEEAGLFHPYHLEGFWGDSEGCGGSRKPHAVW